ncbi:draxin isoform X2 [Hemiscyllium ocellatum]|uniref:draxin isoform X2 n=1 Tax=Hemiscyllium ocellatum TaxID=170820 RepID=UPI0029673660|nr:draxin isoform X2 [Hemiscyllium ocellatum]
MCKSSSVKLKKKSLRCVCVGGCGEQFTYIMSRCINRMKKMAHWYFMSPFLFLLVFDGLNHVCALEAGTRGRKSTLQPLDSSNNLKRHESWPDPLRSGRKHGIQRKDKTNTMVTKVLETDRPDEDSVGLESLTPVRVETDSLERTAVMPQERVTGQKGQFYPQEPEYYPAGESANKGRKHNRDHKKPNRRERARHSKGKLPGTELIPFLKDQTQNKETDEPSTLPLPMSSTIVTSTLLTTITTEEAPATKPRSTRQQVGTRTAAEVNPTLDMTLFDWTDYEDMKPDIWPSAKRKDKRRSKNLSNGNLTSMAEVEPCDHHLDCLPGWCCDLRQHVCKAHNRGLNNKCYDDCMCAEGLRCYAKFHRNRRVTRRRGRCVEPDSVDIDHGSFITV